MVHQIGRRHASCRLFIPLSAPGGTSDVPSTEKVPEGEKAEELRVKFVANREQVRCWAANWDFTEVTWPVVPALPPLWSAIKQNESR